MKSINPAANSTFSCSQASFARLPFWIDKCNPLFERHLGKEYVSKNPRTVQGVVIDYFFSSQAKKPSLKETRKEFENISKLTRELYRALKNIGGPADHALHETWQNRHVNYPETLPHTEIEEALLNFQPLIQIAMDQIPDSRRWPQEFIPERELIRGLAKLYEDSTGHSAKAGSHRRDDIYQGDFFNLVEDIFLTLEVEKHVTGDDEENVNFALGKAIERALK